MAYSMDYRIAVAAAYDECGSSAEVAEQFGCSPGSAGSSSTAASAARWSR